ncbi:endoribonuclease [Salmonella phage vB_SenM-AKM_NP4]|uniref:Uncharacterized protein n=1 Tax=Salmonella phage S16 TaxID=1087482 RepID=M1EAP1_BPS16|nr:hypothetical protein I133_gp152 [Salmonella phage vB_SenM-S16]AEO97072.1 hypothetical protein [Salmonella phage vB_SenM-S16]WDR21782.1 hypothetical protein PJM34_0114 [Salmonella phage vB_SenM_UTK0003]WLI71742.1 endoribonuclease [Salmonella phage vB_SenM-AKM_NP4]
MRTFLTAPYLSLMNAFTHHSDARVDEICKNGWVPPLETLLKEYCTLRLDGGRQSGKSIAVTNFAANWLYDSGTVIVLSNKSAYAELSANHIKKEFSRYSNDDIRFRLFTDSVRSFIGNKGYKFRGLSLSRILYIIDEPVKAPDMDKLYDVHMETMQYCCRVDCYKNNQTARPQFFVIGMQ